MNLLLTTSIITSFMLLQFSNGLSQEIRNCCNNGVFNRDTMSCSRGSISILCSRQNLREDEHLIEKYNLQGKAEHQYLVNNKTGDLLLRNEFCKTYVMKNISINVTNLPLSSPTYIFCAPVNYTRSTRNPTDITTIVAAIFSLISSLMLAITAFIYFIIPQTQDGEGRCIFHFALTLSFCHFWYPYKYFVKDIEILPDLCITKLYLLLYAALSAFLWSSILSYHMWRKFRENVRFDESKLMFRYQLMGYGIPALIVLLANIHTHAISLYYKSSLEWDCWDHVFGVSLLYAVVPWTVIELANVFFFINLQKLLWNMHLPNSEEQSVSFLKKLQFKLKINLRLFIIMGLPWWIIVFCAIFGFWLSIGFLIYIAVFTLAITCLEGILIFCIVVLGRKRVRQGIVDKFGIMRCKPNADMETSVEISVADKNDAGQELEIHISRHIENGK